MIRFRKNDATTSAATKQAGAQTPVAKKPSSQTNRRNNSGIRIFDSTSGKDETTNHQNSAYIKS